MFKKNLAYANSHQHQFKPHNELAFTNYLRWFVSSTRVEICRPAFEPNILDQPNDYYELARQNYNKAVRDGTYTAFAPLVNFVVSTVSIFFVNTIACHALFACLTCVFLFMLSGTRSRTKLMMWRNFWIVTRLVRRKILHFELS
jgi:hypothetical protein